MAIRVRLIFERKVVRGGGTHSEILTFVFNFQEKKIKFWMIFFFSDGTFVFEKVFVVFCLFGYEKHITMFVFDAFVLINCR